MAAQADRKRIAAELAAAEAENERAQKAFAKQLISEKDALEAKYKMEALRAQSEAAQARQSQVGARVQLSQDKLSDTSLTAPFDGAVAARYVDPGSIVQPGTAVLRLVKNGPLRVRFRIPERELNLVRVDMPFEVTTQATGDKHFRGKLTRIAAEVSRTDRTVAVEGVLAKETPLLRPGMYSEVSLDLGRLDAAVVIPSGSILEQVGADGHKRVGVFVVVDDKARWTPISVKGASGDRSAVDTLSAGARVVVLGHDNLRDGAPVRISTAPSP
jgi:RND family efflux transporter MFP subunit